MHKRQCQFINGNITIVGKLRTWTNINPEKSRRQNSRVFRLDGKEICKVMFLNTLAITDRVMRTAINKSKNGYTEKTTEGTQEELTLKRY